MEEKVYGLFDTKDKVWMGDMKGPTLYSASILSKRLEELGKKRRADTHEAYTIARIAAEVMARQLRWEPTRIKAILYDPTPKVKKDEVKTKKSALSVIKHLEAAITMCKGQSADKKTRCPKRGKCWRYRALPGPYQSWFAALPCDVCTKDVFHCRYFIEDKGGKVKPLRCSKA